MATKTKCQCCTLNNTQCSRVATINGLCTQHHNIGCKQRIGSDGKCTSKEIQSRTVIPIRQNTQQKQRQERQRIEQIQKQRQERQRIEQIQKLQLQQQERQMGERVQKLKLQQLETQKPQMIDRLRSEHPDIILELEKHHVPSVSEDPTNTPIFLIQDGVRIRFLPSLQQIRTIEDHSNLCGYYALHSARCLVNQREDLLKNRDIFINETLMSSMVIIKKNRKVGPYDNLVDNEIRRISQNDPLIGVAVLAEIQRFVHPLTPQEIEKFNLPLEETLYMTGSLEEAVGQKSAELINKFKLGTIDRFALIASPGTRRSVTSHWFVILFERLEGQIRLTVTDSLHPINWFDADLISSRILPFYYLVTDQIEKIPQIGGRFKRF